MVYMCHSFLIHSSADGHLGCFHVLAMINSAAMNIGVHVSLSDLVFSTPVLLPEKSHGQRSPVGYSPWGHKESDTTVSKQQQPYATPLSSSAASEKPVVNRTVPLSHFSLAA